MIIKGVIRTLEGIHPIDMAAYYRAAHPSAIRKVKPTEVNVLRRIGSTAVMPGDVAFGGSESVSLIPPHPIVDKAEETPIHDERAQMRLNTGKYKSTDLFSSRENPAFKAEDEECERSKLTK